MLQPKRVITVRKIYFLPYWGAVNYRFQTKVKLLGSIICEYILESQIIP